MGCRRPGPPYGGLPGDLSHEPGLPERIDPLLPRRDYPLQDGSQLRIIRPLILAQEALVERWAREQNILPPPSGCPWESTDSRRREMRVHLEALTGGSAAKKLNMFRGIQ